MTDLINAIKKSLDNENWYAALVTALILPDICGKVETPSIKSKPRYIEWFNKYLLFKYEGFLTADDCYALRCSYIHEGTDNIEGQDAKKILDYFVFNTMNKHCCKFGGNKVKGVDTASFLLLDVQTFCLDFCNAVDKWLQDIVDNIDIKNRIKGLIKIHEDPFEVLGGIYHMYN